MFRFAHIILLLCLIPLLTAWFSSDTVEAIMRDHGFSLQSKRQQNLQYSSTQYTQYIFRHHKYGIVIVNDYLNGFTEINVRTQSKNKQDPTKWQVNALQTISRNNLRATIHKFFVEGHY